MECINCKASCFYKPLSRTNPVGQPDAGWMCQDCIKELEPELYKNLEEDGNLKVTNDIFNAINNKATKDEVRSCYRCKFIYWNESEKQYDCRFGYLGKIVTDDLHQPNDCNDFEKC